MIQHSKFSTGGFVLHKIVINNQKYSAWYDVNGWLIDAERIEAKRTVRVSDVHYPLRRRLNAIGEWYRRLG